MRKTRHLRPFLPLLLLLAAVPLRGEESGGETTPDRVYLANGDRLSGRVERMLGGQLLVTTEHSGAVTVDFSQVVGLTTGGEVTLRLASGERLAGRLLESEGAALRLATALRAEPLALELARVEAINPPAARYRGAVSLGANIQSGNSEQTTLSLAARAERETERDLLSFRLRANDVKEDGARTARNTFGALKYEHTLRGDLYTYVSTELYSDEFKDLDLRTVASVGLGYRLFDSDRFRLSLEGGASYLSQNFIMAEDEDELSLRLGSQLERVFLGRLTLADHLLLYPSFEDGESLQLRNELSLSTEIAAGWALAVTNVLEYDSDPPPNLEEEDLLWVLGLQYSFR